MDHLGLDGHSLVVECRAIERLGGNTEVCIWRSELYPHLS